MSLPRRHRGPSLPYTGSKLRLDGVITRTPFTVTSNSPKVGGISMRFDFWRRSHPLPFPSRGITQLQQALLLVLAPVVLLVAESFE